VTPKLITTLDDLIEALRQRRDELDISHETIDAVSGLQSGYTSKVMARMKGLGAVSLPALLGALAVGLVLVEDPLQRSLIEPRWERRKRAPTARHSDGALLGAASSERFFASIGEQPDAEIRTDSGQDRARLSREPSAKGRPRATDIGQPDPKTAPSSDETAAR
jgi:hypothetical protein